MRDAPPLPEEISAALSRYQPDTRETLQEIRTLVFQAASQHQEIGELTETLKWGEPAYLTEQTGTGSTLRLGQTKKGQRPALFVNCQTDLVDQVRERYPETFDFDGTRAIIPRGAVADSAEEIRHCAAMTLLYHRNKKR